MGAPRGARPGAVALRLPAAFGLQPVGQLRQQAPPCVQLPLLLPGTYRKHRLRLLRSRPESGHRKALLAGSAHEYQRGDRSPPGQMPRGLFAELPARILPPRDQRTDGDCAEHGRKPYLPCPEATSYRNTLPGRLRSRRKNISSRGWRSRRSTANTSSN